jgi:hypothetical protein
MTHYGPSPVTTLGLANDSEQDNSLAEAQRGND